MVAEREIPPPATDPRLERARRQIAILEHMIEDKTRSLYLAQEELREKSAFLERILESMTSALVVTDSHGVITMIGGSTETLTGRAPSDLLDGPITAVLRAAADADKTPTGEPAEAFLLATDGTEIPVILSTSALAAGAEEVGYVHVATDISRQRRLEAELRHAQKLESIGQLAAGVAHEINTPIQFVGDSVNFLGEAITDSLELLAAYGAFRDKAAEHAPFQPDLDVLRDLEEECDLEFIVEEAPRSIERTKDGVRRVAEIVAAMKQFSHPGGGPMAPADVNEIIENTLVVARNEYKYAAELALDLVSSAPAMCDRGDISQVVLNLIVNAAHAIKDHMPEGELGSIRVSTRDVDGGVEFCVQDSGGGVPESIRDRIFDPFFTTKEPGKGTGQGLAFVHSIVVDKHHGRVSLEVEDNIGSAFRVWIPGA